MTKDERGVVTVELAMALPLLLAVTAACAWMLALGVEQVRVIDAARETARAIARGDEVSSAVALGESVAGDDTTFAVRREASDIHVTAVSPLPGPAWVWWPLGDVDVSSTAVARMEET